MCVAFWRWFILESICFQSIIKCLKILLKLNKIKNDYVKIQRRSRRHSKRDGGDDAAEGARGVDVDNITTAAAVAGAIQQPAREPTSVSSASSGSASASSMVNNNDMFNSNSSVSGSAASSTMNSAFNNNRILASNLKFAATTTRASSVEPLGQKKSVAPKSVAQTSKSASASAVDSAELATTMKKRLEDLEREFQTEREKLAKSLDYYKRINQVLKTNKYFLKRYITLHFYLYEVNLLNLSRIW